MNAETIKTIKRLTLIAIGFILLGFIVWSVNKRESSLSGDLNIRVVPPENGRDLMTIGDIQKIIQRNFVFNLAEEKVPLGKLKVGEIERVLEEEPFVLDAEVYIDAQNQLFITTTQRTPILRVIDQDNQTYYMDSTGRQMPMSDHSTARVIVATGEIPPYTPDFQKPKKRHLLKRLFALTKFIQKDEFLDAMIEQIYVNKSKEFVLIPKVGKQKIIFGKYENVADKFDRLKIFYKEVMPREGWQKYKTINLKYRKQVVAQRR
ncbi:MAG: cell division protein FtsQ [Bacteroidota bacterium]